MLDFVRTDRPTSDENDREALGAVETARDLVAELEQLAITSDATTDLSGSLAVLHRSGLPMAVFARTDGGCGLLEPEQAGRLAQVLRFVGAGDLSIARLFEGHVNAAALVGRFGTRQQVSALAGAVQRGALSAVWNAEGAEPLTAVADTDGLRLTGRKILASGAGSVTRPIVTPRVDGAVVMLLLDGLAPERIDLSAWHPTGMRASATGTIDLSGLLVPHHMQIGEGNEYLRQPWFSGGAWRFCAVHLGAAERLLDLFRLRLQQRRRTDDPYQKARIAAATAACVTARFWIDKAAGMLATGSEDASAVVAFANLTRSVTERACLDVIELVQRGVGLGAFMHPDPIERIMRDLATYLRQPVPDAAMADAAAHVLACDGSVADLWTA